MYRKGVVYMTKAVLASCFAYVKCNTHADPDWSSMANITATQAYAAVKSMHSHITYHNPR